MNTASEAFGIVVMVSALVGQARAAELPAAAEVLKETGVSAGLAVVVGTTDGALEADLANGGKMLIQGLALSDEALANARKHVADRTLQGRVSIVRFAGRRLPYVDNLLNLVLVLRPDAVERDEALRVLAPLGVAYFKQDGAWTKTVKPWPKEMDEWTHFLHGPDNNAVSKDFRVGPPARVQWTAGPRWARSHEITPSFQGLVSAAGRMFYIWDRNPIGMFDDRFPDDTFFNRSWWALSENFPYYTRCPETGPKGQLLVFSGSGVYGVRVFRRVSNLGGRSADFSPGEGRRPGCQGEPKTRPRLPGHLEGEPSDSGAGHDPGWSVVLHRRRARRSRRQGPAWRLRGPDGR
jgi:hypothetical protein